MHFAAIIAREKVIHRWNSQYTIHAVSNFSHEYIVAVNAFLDKLFAIACTNGNVQVTDGPSDTEGRAEICKNWCLQSNL